MRVFVSTCDKYDAVIKPFMYLFNKFWDSDIKVTILGYRKPNFDLYDNFDFVSIADKQENVNQWSTDFRNYFESIEDEHFLWTVEDSYLIRPFNKNIFNELNKYLDDENLGRISLVNATEKKQHNILEKHEDFNIIEQGQNTEYRISVLWSVWKKDYLLKYLTPNQNPWDFEWNQSQRAKNDGFKVLGSSILHGADHACGRRVGQGSSIPLDFNVRWKNYSLDEETINDMIDKKIINKDRSMIV